LIEARWGESAPFSLGVEEEVMILDAETLEPAAAIDVLLRETEGLTLPGRLKTELHASIVELNTGVCATVQEAAEALAELRAAAAAAARRNGFVVGAAGTHPFFPLESFPVVQEERYLQMIEVVGLAARRQGVNGLHVHVGMASADECWERLEAVLPWLPVVLAMSANSPWLEGRLTGMQSNRAPVLAELPRAGAPPAFGSYAGWEAWVERLVAAGALLDHTRIWWDVRPHPTLGTLEIRAPDQPTALERTAFLVALLRGLVEHAPARAADPGRRGDYAQNRWAAARWGLDGELIHPDGDRSVPARELAAELVALAHLDVAVEEPEAHVQLAAPDARAAAAEIVDRSVA
jgi:carboxylate-amine ligase